MKKNCLYCGKPTSHAEMPVELVGGEVLCYYCSEDIRYDIKKIYKNMSEESYIELRNKILETSKSKYNDSLVEVLAATIDRMYYGDKNLNMDTIHQAIAKQKNSVTYSASTVSHSSLSTNNETGMFGNIGGKIKALAQVITWIGIIVSILIGIITMSTSGPVGILIAVAGSLISWISSFILYGFGQLIENSDELVRLLSENKKP